MTKNKIQEFEAMFDLSVTKNEDEVQAEEYGNIVEAEESFDKLVKEVNEDIEKVSDKGVEVEYKVEEEVKEEEVKEEEVKEEEVKEEEVKEEEVKEEVVLDVIKEIIEVAKENTKEEPKLSLLQADFDADDFDVLSEQTIDKKEVEVVHKQMKEIEIVDRKKEVVEDIFGDQEIVVCEENEEKQVEDKFSTDSVLDEIIIDNRAIVVDDKINWSLKSPSAMYDKFYRQKKIVLDSCLVGGQVEFSVWSKELREAQVDVVSEVFDQQVIVKQMEDVQQFRNRIKYIGVRVNNQYFLFDRFIALLRGYLARIQYIKPILKQDGLILEHMGDVELYMERLKGLHKSVSDTEKNLAAAHEMLSRKATICMDLPAAERFERSERFDRSEFSQYIAKFQNVEKKEKEIKVMDDFDDLPNNAVAGSVVKKSGSVEWENL